MSEKLYKTVSNVGAGSIAGARLLKSKSDMMI